MLSRKLQKSPVKENISPDGLQLSPRKRNNDLKHLIQLLKQHNIAIPQQLIEKIISKQKNTCQLKLKQVLCDNTTQIKNLKIELSDIKFQLKKTQEDFAEYKVMTRMEKQKMIKKYLFQIDQLKKRIEDDNNNWEKQYTETCNKFSTEKKVYEQKLNQHCQLKIHQQSTVLQTTYQQKITSLEEKVESLKISMEQQQQLFEKQKQHIIEKYEEKAKAQIQSLRKNTTQKQKEITQKFENKIQTIQLQKKIDTRKFQELIQKLQKDVQNLQSDCYFLNKEKDQLNTEIKSKQRKILQLQMAIRAKQQVLIQTKEEFQQQKINICNQNEKKIQKVRACHLKEIQKIKKQHLNQIDGYYFRINSLQQRKIAIESQYKDQMKIIQQKFSDRVSKNEDVEEIQKLNTILTLKDKEIARYQDELKSSELLRVNNELNYTKIFNSSRRKSSNSYREKQLAKQSNTTDLKVLLKICNKQF